MGAIAVGDLVKSTLGPKGMDKILISASGKEMQTTNDGATILKSIALDNAAAKVLVNLSKVQDEEVGDGTTSVCVLAAELLREAEKLIETARLHPQLVAEGYREASQAARKALEAASVRPEGEAALREALLAIARTTLSSKVLAQSREQFAQLAVEAVMRLDPRSPNLELIQMIKRPGGRLTDSFLADGFILDKSMPAQGPRSAQPARILVANTAMDADKIKVFGARFRVDSPAQLAEMERAERARMAAKVERIKATGANVFVNRQLIYNWPEQLLAEAGILAIEHADFEGVERLAAATGAQIASTFDQEVRLGQAAQVEEVLVGEDRLIRFGGCAQNGACTVVLRGATQQLLDEAERSLHDAFCVLTQTLLEPRTVLGGGSAEMLMAKAVDDLLPQVAGKKALAIEAFSRALRQLPTILADNGGYDASELVSQLRAAHAQGQSWMGLDMYRGQIADMRLLGVTESLKLKRQVLMSAAEAAEMIVRVDDIVRAAPRERTKH